MSGRLQVQLGSDHRLWCGLFTSNVPRCTCGQLSVEQLVGWWVAQAGQARGRYHADAGCRMFVQACRVDLSKGR